METTRKDRRRSFLRLTHPPDAPSTPAARPGPKWSINGWPATIWTWTAEEWARLVSRPPDAMPCPNGVWCLLRMDPPAA